MSFCKEFIFLVMFCVLTDALECPPGEIYTACGAACQRKCGNSNVMCPAICSSGCICEQGKVRNENGACVYPEQCLRNTTTACPVNEEYKSCGTSCPATCSQPNPKICNEMCNSGCFCLSGYVRDQTTGRCVIPSECQCPKGESLQTCGTACPATCQKPSPGICTYQCVIGCFCNEGRIRDERTGRCVRRRECTNGNQIQDVNSNTCPQGEVFKNCGTDCEATCSNPNPICTLNCRRGCFCPRGQVRDDFNDFRCINREQCPIVNYK